MQPPNCRLFLVAPSSGDPQALTACLSAALAAGDVASLVVPPQQPLVQAMMATTRKYDVAVLIDEDAEMVRAMDADGVHLSAADASYALARAQVPLFHIHGDIDKVVPLEDNSGELARRYAKLNGDMELKIIEGQGHNRWSGWFRDQDFVDFVIQYAGTHMKNLPNPDSDR